MLLAESSREVASCVDASVCVSDTITLMFERATQLVAGSAARPEVNKASVPSLIQASTSLHHHRVFTTLPRSDR